MNDSPILHHYDMSPFAEKARLMLGWKALPWRSVKIPPINPKPDLVALTGGYRKTPVMQEGADIWCDTALIARRLEALRPTPALFPASAPLAPMLAQWADSTLFWTLIPVVMQPAGFAHVFEGVPPETVKGFGADRAAFTAGMRRQTLADASANLDRYLLGFDTQLSDGRPYLFGAEASIADFSVGHGLWFLHRVPALAALVDGRAALGAWLQRMLAIGHGHSEPMTSAQAIETAAASSGHLSCAVEQGLGFEAGEKVTVAATDYGTDPVAGSLVGLSRDEIVVERQDERAGRLHVHFPRAGFQLKRDAA